METPSAVEAVNKDAAASKSEIVSYLGDALDLAQSVAAAVKDDESALRATELGQQIKGRIKWLEGRRVAIYEPLRDATENVRQEYDKPIKLGKQLEKTLASAVIDYNLKKRREEERVRLEREAEAKRQKEEADRKEREAAAERERIIKEQQIAEEKKRQEAAELERQRVAKEEADRKAIAEKKKAEDDERARKIKEEEDARLANATEARDVGLPERSETILSTPTAIAPVAAPLPSAAEREAERARLQKIEDERIAAEREKEATRKLDEEKKAADLAKLKRMDEEAAAARQKAAESEHAAAMPAKVERPTDGMRINETYKWDVPDEASFRKLCLAIGEGRAPVEYGGFNPLEPEKFRAGAVTKDLNRLKDQFEGEKIGIRVWKEQGGTFKAAEVAA